MLMPILGFTVILDSLMFTIVPVEACRRFGFIILTLSPMRKPLGLTAAGGALGLWLSSLGMTLGAGRSLPVIPASLSRRTDCSI
jgi:hypothetical protein